MNAGVVLKSCWLWLAGKEIENSSEEEMTYSFGELSNGIAGIDVIGKHARYLMEYLGVDPQWYQNHVMFVPDDSSCYCCCKLKELTESSPELSLSTVRQLIIELYPRLFRYQVWNLQSGQPLLHDVFNQGAQLNPFEYFCHVTSAFDEWGAATKWSGVVKAVSVCNIAVVNAVSFLLKLELERFFNGQLPKIPEPDWKRMISGENERYTMYVRAYVKNLREKVIKKSSRCHLLLHKMELIIHRCVPNPRFLHDMWLDVLAALPRALAPRHSFLRLIVTLSFSAVHSSRTL